MTHTAYLMDMAAMRLVCIVLARGIESTERHTPTNNRRSRMAKSDGELLAAMGTDATLWAAEFARVVTVRAHDELVAAAKQRRATGETRGEVELRIGLDPTPGGMLHGWLCNAIEAGRAAGRYGPRFDLPADPAGSDAPPADVAGSDLPADPAGRSRDVLERLAEAVEYQAEVLDAFRAAYARATMMAGTIPPPTVPSPSRVDTPRAPWQDEAEAP